MIWQIPKIWEGGECWILGGGPSLPRQFGVPEDVIEQVRTRQQPLDAFSPYFSAIHSRHVIGVNAAFLLGSWVDIAFFGDKGFYFKNHDIMRQFPNLKVVCNDGLKSKVVHERLKLVARDGNRRRGISTRPGCVSWNGNSGGAAINLAVQLGVKKIYLLGYDMQADSEDKQHWHAHYIKNLNKKKDPKRLPFHRHIVCFQYIAKDAKKQGIEIINVNPDSAIQDFKRVSLNEVL